MDIISEITGIETIAEGRGIRELSRLSRLLKKSPLPLKGGEGEGEGVKQSADFTHPHPGPLSEGEGVTRVFQPPVRKVYGLGQWKKKKGIAIIRLETGETVRAEIHWYEAHGIGKREFKIKRIPD